MRTEGLSFPADFLTFPTGRSTSSPAGSTFAGRPTDPLGVWDRKRIGKIVHNSARGRLRNLPRPDSWTLWSPGWGFLFLFPKVLVIHLGERPASPLPKISPSSFRPFLGQITARTMTATNRISGQDMYLFSSLFFTLPQCAIFLALQEQAKHNKRNFILTRYSCI